MEEKEKITSSGGISYSGAVKIKLRYGDNKPYKVIEKHNVGTAAFFTFILNCIRGHNIPNERPYYMGLYKDKACTQRTVNNWFKLSGDSAPQVVSESGVEGNFAEDKVMVALTAEIADVYISGRSFQGIKIINKDEEEYARIALDDLVEVTGKNSNVIIDWVIYLGNAKIQEEVEED